MNKFNFSAAHTAPALSILIFLVSAAVAFHTGDAASFGALMILAAAVVNSINAYFKDEAAKKQRDVNIDIATQAVQQVQSVEEKLDTNTAMTKSVAVNVVEVKRQTNGLMASAVAEKVAEKFVAVAEATAEKVAADAAVAAQKIVDAAARIESEKQVKPETAAAVVSLGQKPPEPK